MALRRFVVSRRAALGLLGAGAPLLIESPGPARAQPRLDRVSFVTNWRAQAEHGGFYQAQTAGLYRSAGLEVELRSGGPQVNPAQLLLGGRVDMSMGNGVTALNFVQQNLPFLCVGAVFQKGNSLRGCVDRAIGNLRANGTIAKIEKQYLARAGAPDLK